MKSSGSRLPTKIALSPTRSAGTANSFDRYCKIMLGSLLSAFGKSAKFLRIVFFPSQVISIGGNSKRLPDEDVFEIFFSILFNKFS